MTPHDLILIGAGPCGLAAATKFKQSGLNYLHIEAGKLAQTIHNFPAKIKLYSNRRDLEIGDIPFQPEPDKPPTREEYLDYLSEASSRLGLEIKTNRRAISLITGNKKHLVYFSGKDGKSEEASSSNIVVASGGYYAPQLLNIPGEGQPNVSHFFNSELPFEGERVLVVGGRNSAIEAAIILAKKNAEVILSYRGTRFPRKKIKPWLLPEFDEAKKKGIIRVLYRTVPSSIHDREVELKSEENKKIKIEADKIFLLTGYGPDYNILQNASVPFHKSSRRPLFNSQTLETKKPGIFLCGTVVLKWQGRPTNIGNTRDHWKIILKNLR